MHHLSEIEIFPIECLIFQNQKFPSYKATHVKNKNFSPWMPQKSIFLDQKIFSLNASSNLFDQTKDFLPECLQKCVWLNQKVFSLNASVCFAPWMLHFSELIISLLECLICLNWKLPSFNPSFFQTKNFFPWMPQKFFFLNQKHLI